MYGRDLWMDGCILNSNGPDIRCSTPHAPPPPPPLSPLPSFSPPSPPAHTLTPSCDATCAILRPNSSSPECKGERGRKKYGKGRGEAAAWMHGCRNSQHGAALSTLTSSLQACAIRARGGPGSGCRVQGALNVFQIPASGLSFKGPAVFNAHAIRAWAEPGFILILLPPLFCHHTPLTNAPHVGGGLGVLQHPLAHARRVLTRATCDVLDILGGSKLLCRACVRGGHSRLQRSSDTCCAQGRRQA